LLLAEGDALNYSSNPFGYAQGQRLYRRELCIVRQESPEFIEGRYQNELSSPVELTLCNQPIEAINVDGFIIKLLIQPITFY
jgi:hypothetical protein